MKKEKTTSAPSLVKKFNNVGEVLHYWATGEPLFYFGKKIEYFKPPVCHSPAQMIENKGIYLKLHHRYGLFFIDCNEVQALEYPKN